MMRQLFLKFFLFVHNPTFLIISVMLIGEERTQYFCCGHLCLLAVKWLSICINPGTLFATPSRELIT